jgi:dTDP-4-dehydrorhamnose 3,5-epimerase
MKFRELPLAGAYAIDLDKREDDRGFFARYFCQREFQEQGLVHQWVQINNSYCRHRGTLRGLHYQVAPREEAKLVRCISGSIFDAMIDMRRESPTFGSWAGIELSAANRTMIYVPPGFAHGYLSLCDHAEVLYGSSEFYSPDHERAVHWNDPFHGIQWPIEPLHLSEKDRATPFLNRSIL